MQLSHHAEVAGEVEEHVSIKRGLLIEVERLIY